MRGTGAADSDARSGTRGCEIRERSGRARTKRRALLVLRGHGEMLEVLWQRDVEHATSVVES